MISLSLSVRAVGCSESAAYGKVREVLDIRTLQILKVSAKPKVVV